MAKHASSLVSLVALVLVGLGMQFTSACTWVPEEGTAQQDDTYTPPADVVGGEDMTEPTPDMVSGEDVNVPPDLGGPDTGNEPDVETCEDIQVPPDACTPDCVDRECGDDGCGGTCGACGDDNVCTVDSCDAGNCIHEFDSEGCECADDATCDDGDSCNGLETCNETTGECLNGMPVVCTEGEECVDGLCEDVINCTDADGDGYGDGPDCDGPDCDDIHATVNPGQQERCGNSRDDNCDGQVNEGCGPLPQCSVDAQCDDENPCTENHCVAGACESTNRYEVPCDDNNACTVDDECKAGECVAGPNADCVDNDPRTMDSCDPNIGCVHDAPAPQCDADADCVDENSCTSDGCFGGYCVHRQVPGCGECVPVCVDRECGDDGCGGTCGTCGNDETCVDSMCVAVDLCEGVNCDDENNCTQDVCDPDTGVCVHTPLEGCGHPVECAMWGTWVHGLTPDAWRLGQDPTGTSSDEADFIVLPGGDNSFGSPEAHSVWGWRYPWGDDQPLPEGLLCEDRCGNLLPPFKDRVCDSVAGCEWIFTCTTDGRR